MYKRQVFSGGIAGELGFYIPLIENCSVKGNITARSKQQGVKMCIRDRYVYHVNNGE